MTAANKTSTSESADVNVDAEPTQTQVWALRQVRVLLVLIVTLTLIGLTPWLVRALGATNRGMSSNARPLGNAHLGGEYGNIATSLAAGNGFSSPFRDDTGPTAWMPPLLVWIQAALIWLFSFDRYAVLITVVVIKSIVLFFCTRWVITRPQSGVGRWLAVGVAATFLIGYFTDWFTFTHDGWLILGMVTATVAGCERLWENQQLAGGLSGTRVVKWGLLGGFAALASPVAGFTWAVLTTYVLVRKHPAMWLFAGLISMAVVAPWTLRNRVMLGHWIPVKSNVYFELDQSLRVDSDGLLDWNTFSQHPYVNNRERNRYRSLGEINYLAEKRERFWSDVTNHPEKFLRNISSRFLGATFFPAGFSEYAQPSLTLPLRWLLYPWPAVCVIWLIVRWRRTSALQRLAVLTYVTYLLPYVICSYYPRYEMPLLTTKMLLVYWLISTTLSTSEEMTGSNQPLGASPRFPETVR